MRLFRKITLLNFAAVALLLFMIIKVLVVNHTTNYNNGWDIFAIFIFAGFSSLLIVVDYFIQTKIKNRLKLFFVELFVLIIVVGIGFLLINN